MQTGLPPGRRRYKLFHLIVDKEAVHLRCLRFLRQSPHVCCKQHFLANDFNKILRQTWTSAAHEFYGHEHYNPINYKIMDVILETANLTRKISDKTIVDDFTFAFERHGIYNILGPSGAGKSSLLRLFNRLDEPSSGTMIFNGKPQCDYTPCQLRRNISYLFQTPYLFPGTVRANLLYGEKNLSDEMMRDLLKQVRLKTDYLDVDSENLSIGEKQRVAIARLLAIKPDILLLDEPTSALDPANTEAIELLIREIVARKALTVIMVTHNPEQASRMGGRALLLVKGKLIEHGPAGEVVNSPRTELGKQYKAKELHE